MPETFRVWGSRGRWATCLLTCCLWEICEKVISFLVNSQVLYQNSNLLLWSLRFFFFIVRQWFEQQQHSWLDSISIAAKHYKPVMFQLLTMLLLTNFRFVFLCEAVTFIVNSLAVFIYSFWFCSFYEAVTFIANALTVRFIRCSNLAKNNLTGNLPYSISTMPSLSYLWVPSHVVFFTLLWWKF